METVTAASVIIVLANENNELEAHVNQKKRTVEPNVRACFLKSFLEILVSRKFAQMKRYSIMYFEK